MGAQAKPPPGGAGDLGAFMEAKEESLAGLRKRTDWGTFGGPRPGFGEALSEGRRKRGLGLIAEYKRASPSLGDINLALSPEEAALAYSGADCLSVLTEERFFKGHLGFLGRMAAAGKPELRKDFIFDPLQVRETAGTPASALLLIVRLTPDAVLLAELFRAAADLGLEAVVEVFGLGELDKARRLGASLIQFNSRDLGSLAVDRGAILGMARKEPPQPGETYIAASGLRVADDLKRAADAGFGAVLVGTALMRSGDPGKALDALLAGLA
jgi:indole-3-glycerol phosphate synthase